MHLGNNYKWEEYQQLKKYAYRRIQISKSVTQKTTSLKQKQNNNKKNINNDRHT